MRQLLCLGTILLFIFAAGNLTAQQTAAPDAGELTTMLNEFLAGATRNDPAAHDKFWAEDLIYTGSSGRRISKADIMKDVRSTPPPKPDEVTTIYTAEDVRIQQYGTTAVVAFRLVATAESFGSKDVSNYLNSGTFLKRDGKWKVVNWQATKLPRSPEESLKEAMDAEAALNKTLLVGDAPALERMLDEKFLWTQDDGTHLSRKQLMDDISSGKLKYTLLETKNPAGEVFGDTAVVRGETTRKRKGDEAPFTAFYTLTFARIDGVWKAIALHTSKAK